MSKISTTFWLLLVGLAAAALASDTPKPTSVTLAGDLQQELGCAADWTPDCAATHLTYDADDDVWQGSFAVPAGSWQYKAPLNDSWDENYGLHAVRGGDNIPLALGAGQDVKFYYSHATHWITDNFNSLIATAAGSFQEELGCPGDWQPWCLRSWLQDPEGDGTYSFTTEGLPAGNYEMKAALYESWDVNYGEGGVQNGPNIAFSIAENCAATTFSYNGTSHVLAVGAAAAAAEPASVTIAGSLQQELGCAADWTPDCAATHLTYDAEDGVWQGSFAVPAGNWEYKAALNNSWDENYGAHAARGGANISLNLEAAQTVKFYYSHGTHWVTDNVGSIIAVSPGNFQSETGCGSDWQPSCLRTWLQDPDGDGLYTFVTRKLAAGNYEAKVALDESWDVNYGEGGVPGGANIVFSVPTTCAPVYFTWDSNSKVLNISTSEGGPRGNLALARAYFVDRATLAWNSAAAQNAAQVLLHWADDGVLQLTAEGVEGGSSLPLSRDPAGLPAAVLAKYPHLAGYAAYKISPADQALVPALLKARLAVSALDGNGAGVDATSVQIPGVLDDLYTYSGPLGISWQGNRPSLRLWAPTARAVNLHRFAAAAGGEATVAAMTLDGSTGTWSITGDNSWKNQYYLYEVEVYAPSTAAIEKNLVTDPYSLALAANSTRSQIVDLGDPEFRPPGWNGLKKPALQQPEDTVLYELHVRDFSWNDASVPAELRGTFRAFTLANSNGMKHLAALAPAGLTHLHLLPSFDIATVDENRANHQQADFAALAALPPASEDQQAAATAIESTDGFNWGYDPWHYTVPEGSYATEANGGGRSREFREMVQALNQKGLRVVMDVVYNHTNAAGQNAKSVLDRVVPGYYHRLSKDGVIEQSSCCPNTASENNMMEKLMVDSLVTWAREYKVDGFRFDLMGHHMKRNLLAVRAALDALTPAQDGVDGKAIVLYGEGWNFGEVANNARGENAVQANMAGTGIATFNDRLRDGARGGGPFSGLKEQGFLTGLYVDPNGTDQGDAATQLARLRLEQDWIKVGIAGSLADYRLIDRGGNLVAARDIDYNGQRSGYTADPQEVINYIDAHDNETLFDAAQFKLPESLSAAQRARVSAVGQALLLVSQGIPFFHAGSDLLRSKSLDRDSYNSGDWFNRIDCTLTDNGWGSGLPVASKNQSNWPLMAPLLSAPGLEVGPAEIAATAASFRSFLEVRRSSPLFRLGSAAAVARSLRFLDTSSSPGTIAFVLDDVDQIDPARGSLLVVIHAGPGFVDLSDASLVGKPYSLHHALRDGADPVVNNASFDAFTGLVRVPARTVAVFETREGRFAPCVPAPNTLCLGQNGRFKVEINWRDFGGQRGAGRAVDIGAGDSGLFYFFSPNNLEMLVKVLDGCAYNQRHWVWASATTNVEFTLQVTDTEAGTLKEYHNPSGHLALPVMDTEAFDNCH